MSGVDAIFSIAILIMSVVIHEVSHGYAALTLGDSTAKYMGRLTLNPLRHLDVFGSVILPLLLVIANSPFLIGWAKPVPYNPYNLRNQRWGPAVVAVAGPLSNMLVAAVFGLLVRFFWGADVFNAAFIQFAAAITYINIMLAVFNLVPIPPLDGSKVLFSALPQRLLYVQNWLEAYGMMLLLVFIFFFSSLLVPVIFAFFQLLTGLAPLEAIFGI